MAIYKHGQGFVFVATVKQIQAFSRVELEPGTARLVFYYKLSLKFCM